MANEKANKPFARTICSASEMAEHIADAILTTPCDRNGRPIRCYRVALKSGGLNMERDEGGMNKSALENAILAALIVHGYPPNA